MSATHESQNKKILNALYYGATLTPLLALHCYGCMRLGARVWDLRRQGHRIDRHMVTDKHTGKRYAAYSMPREG